MKPRLIQAVVLVTIIFAGYSVAQQPRADSQRKRVIQPAGSRPGAAFSPAILAGDTLYMSGSIGSDPATGQLAKGGFASAAPLQKQTGDFSPRVSAPRESVSGFA